ncbi:hypothetical protein CUR178_03717 [Leishmania enriettii]|uniref:Uncharacterized protein n=1 Tax=Leishmania enriettii TaxID=5663 RepID=A0A836KK82_LEIEN|nr:hypothetical protein CUR178_03717 [Leishmania enriettii]
MIKSCRFSYLWHIARQLRIPHSAAMSQGNDDWGDMVLPGVYMIRRCSGTGTTGGMVQSGKTANLELVHLEIDEMEKHIELLQKSNREIAAYLKEKQESRSAQEEGEGSGSMVALSDGGVGEEGDDEAFREAMEENILVVARKKKELEHLRALIGGQRCGCLCTHTQDQDPQSTAALSDQARITL